MSIKWRWQLAAAAATAASSAHHRNLINLPSTATNNKARQTRGRKSIKFKVRWCPFTRRSRRQGERSFAAGLISPDEDTHRSLFELLSAWSKGGTLIYFGVERDFQRAGLTFQRAGSTWSKTSSAERFVWDSGTAVWHARTYKKHFWHIIKKDIWIRAVNDLTSCFAAHALNSRRRPCCWHLLTARVFSWKNQEYKQTGGQFSVSTKGVMIEKTNNTSHLIPSMRSSFQKILSRTELL